MGRSLDGDALLLSSAGHYVLVIDGMFVDASVEEWWKTVGGLCRTPHHCGCLGDLRGHV